MAQKESDKIKQKYISVAQWKFVAHEEEISSRNGNWLLICDSQFRDSSSLTEADRVWNDLQLFHQKNSYLYPKYPQRIDHGDTATICYYTSDFRKENEIRSCAEDLRKSISYPYVMCYWKSKMGDVMYMHTPDNELYEFKKTGWKHISGYDPEGITDISRNKSFKDEAVSNVEEDIPLPTQVIDKESLFIPPAEELKKLWTNEGGKWMILNYGSLIHQDELWRALLHLYRRGTLVALKSSTALESKAQIQNKHKASSILCYTKDSNDTTDLKATADAIMDITEYKDIMYYKTNEATLGDNYIH